jgi:activating signal cointegrator complex subunit 1
MHLKNIINSLFFNPCFVQRTTSRVYPSPLLIKDFLLRSCRGGWIQTRSVGSSPDRKMAKKKGRSVTSGYKGGQTSTSTGQDQPKRPQLTHFLCLPLVTEISKPQLEDSLRHFQEHVTNGLASRGTQVKPPPFSSKAIRPTGTIHLTLGVMSLLSEERLEAAIGLLKSLDLAGLIHDSVQKGFIEEGSEATDAKPLIISLSSLVSMHAPQQTSILYATPEDPTERLYPFCTKLRSIFEAESYLTPDDRPLKLHATIVNTIYAKAGGRGRPPRSKPQSGPPKVPESTTNEAPSSPIQGTDEIEASTLDTSVGHGTNARGSLRFDATALMTDFEKFIWAKDFRIENLAICKMGAKKITGPNGGIIGEEYEMVASIPLPS